MTSADAVPPLPSLASRENGQMSARTPVMLTRLGVCSLTLSSVRIVILRPVPAQALQEVPP